MPETPPQQHQLDAVADRYDPRTDFDAVLIRSSLKLLADRMKGPRVLEVGCSTGVATEWLAERGGELEVVDGSQQYLDAVRRRIEAKHPAVRFACALWEQFEPAAPYDDLVFAHGLEHVGAPVSLLRKMTQWLKPGGRLHILVPNARSIHRRVGVAMGLLDRVDELNDRDRLLGHQRVYDESLLRSHLVDAGFRVLELVGNFLKPLSNAQMLALDPRVADALALLARDLPADLCAELHAECEVASG